MRTRGAHIVARYNLACLWDRKIRTRLGKTAEAQWKDNFQIWGPELEHLDGNNYLGWKAAWVDRNQVSEGVSVDDLTEEFFRVDLYYDLIEENKGKEIKAFLNPRFFKVAGVDEVASPRLKALENALFQGSKNGPFIGPYTNPRDLSRYP